MNGFTDDQIELRKEKQAGIAKPILAQTAKHCIHERPDRSDSLSAFMLRFTLKKTWLT
jgi:hypothetical protein